MCRRQDTAWHQAELFNLTQAFQRQLDRIRTEWGDYLVAMDKEYITEQACLEGESPAVALQRYEAERGTVARSGGASDKWLSKEKQEQLVRRRVFVCVCLFPLVVCVCVSFHATCP